MSGEFTIQLPNGNEFWLRMDVTDSQAVGLLVRCFVSFLPFFRLRL